MLFCVETLFKPHLGIDSRMLALIKAKGGGEGGGRGVYSVLKALLHSIMKLVTRYGGLETYSIIYLLDLSGFLQD